MEPDDYKRFLGFLKQHDCHLPFQRFRTMLKVSGAERLPGRPPAGTEDNRGAAGRTG